MREAEQGVELRLLSLRFEGFTSGFTYIEASGFQAISTCKAALVCPAVLSCEKLRMQLL